MKAPLRMPTTPQKHCALLTHTDTVKAIQAPTFLVPATKDAVLQQQGLFEMKTSKHTARIRKSRSTLAFYLNFLQVVFWLGVLMGLFVIVFGPFYLVFMPLSDVISLLSAESTFDYVLEYLFSLLSVRMLWVVLEHVLVLSRQASME